MKHLLVILAISFIIIDLESRVHGDFLPAYRTQTILLAEEFRQYLSAFQTVAHFLGIAFFKIFLVVRVEWIGTAADFCKADNIRIGSVNQPYKQGSVSGRSIIWAGFSGIISLRLASLSTADTTVKYFCTVASCTSLPWLLRLRSSTSIFSSAMSRSLFRKNAPEGRILKSDVTVAKNYLPEQRIRQLERAITGYFDYIEDLIEQENTFTMEGFAVSVNEFLSFRRYDILRDKGRASRKQA